MISKDLEQIIVAIKAKPNSLRRNKAVSHGEDMLAHVKLLEMEESARDVSDGLREPYNASNDLEKRLDREFYDPVAACVCPAGTRYANCPVHGKG